MKFFFVALLGLWLFAPPGTEINEYRAAVCIILALGIHIQFPKTWIDWIPGTIGAYFLLQHIALQGFK